MQLEVVFEQPSYIYLKQETLMSPEERLGMAQRLIARVLVALVQQGLLEVMEPDCITIA